MNAHCILPTSQTDDGIDSNDIGCTLGENFTNDHLKCSVCGDRASGIHYKVLSCDGCRGFFKRSVRKGITELCKGKSDCLVNKQTRTACKACRYKKCIDQGMSINAVLGGKYGKKDSSSVSSKSTSTLQQSNNSKTKASESIQYSSKESDTFESKVVSLAKDVLIESRVYVYKDKLLLSREWSQIAKESFLAVMKWVTNYSEIKVMNSCERSILLEDNWPILFIITICQFNDAQDALKMLSMLFFARGGMLRIDNQNTCDKLPSFETTNTVATCDATVVLYRLREVILQLQNLKCDSEEFSHLKTIALFYPASEDLKLWNSAAAGYKSASEYYMNYLAKKFDSENRLKLIFQKISTLMTLIASIRGFSWRKIWMVFSPALDIDQPIDRVFWSSIINNNLL